MTRRGGAQGERFTQRDTIRFRARKLIFSPKLFTNTNKKTQTRLNVRCRSDVAAIANARRHDGRSRKMRGIAAIALAGVSVLECDTLTVIRCAVQYSGRCKRQHVVPHSDFAGSSTTAEGGAQPRQTDDCLSCAGGQIPQWMIPRPMCSLVISWWLCEPQTSRHVVLLSPLFPLPPSLFLYLYL